MSNESMLARVDGPFNAVQVSTAHGGDFVFYGRGAGGDPTATAVLADVVEIARSGHRAGVPPFGVDALAPFAPAGPADSVAPFYLRFVVDDRPGILAELTTVLARHDINVDAVFQAPWTREERALPFVVTLEPVDEERLGRALVEIGGPPLPRGAAARPPDDSLTRLPGRDGLLRRCSRRSRADLPEGPVRLGDLLRAPEGDLHVGPVRARRHRDLGVLEVPLLLVEPEEPLLVTEGRAR